jgi:hypothetical protein
MYVAVRVSGSFILKTSTATVQGINRKNSHRIQMGNGECYHPVSPVQHLIGKERASSPA